MCLWTELNQMSNIQGPARGKLICIFIDRLRFRRGGGTRPTSGYRWGAEDLKPWSCLGQKNSKIHTLFRTIPSTLLPIVGKHAGRLVFKPFIGNYNRANSRYSHCFCILGIQTNFILFIIRTDSCEITYPVWDREVKTHTLSRDASPYRTFGGLSPLPGSILVLISGSELFKVLKITPQIIITRSLLVTENKFFLVCCKYVLISTFIIL